MNILFLYSLFDEDNTLPESGSVSLVMRDRLILFGAIFLVACLASAGILHRRERKRRRSFHRAAAGVAEVKKMISKRQRHRRAHRPRNPTLAETGGLPPARSDTPRGPSA